MASPAVEAMLASERGFTVAAAGCGKTELLGQLVADPRSRRQLVLTHTHAGVAALKRRLASMKVPSEKFRLETIAGWCMRFSAAYPGISGYQTGPDAAPDWEATYPGAEKVCRTALGRRVLSASYAGVLVDEYQDCTLPMHAVVRAIADCIPARAVGDPLQTVFTFREPCVSWGMIQSDFEVLDSSLVEPWRWRRAGGNRALGDWLVAARQELQETKQLVVPSSAPVRVLPYPATPDAPASWADACRSAGAPNESVIAVLRWPKKCVELAKRLGGRWPVVERFDDPDLLNLGNKLVTADGPTAMSELVGFVAERMTGLGASLATAVDAITAGRGIGRISTNRDHAERLALLASKPTPAHALAWLEGVLKDQRDDWWLYRRDCVFQLKEALQHCRGTTLGELPVLIADARTRARHQGRLTHRHAIGTPLLVKGLEFDHGVILWEPDQLSVEGLYVALTRASKSLTIVSKSRTLVPNGN